jgi:uncharacterized membrane protein YciS (DUF1049 family)
VFETARHNGQHSHIDRVPRVHAIINGILILRDRWNLDSHSDRISNFFGPREKLSIFLKAVNESSVSTDQVIAVSRIVSESMYNISILSGISQSINTAILNCSAGSFRLKIRFRLAYKIGSLVFAVEFCEQFRRL